LIADTHFKKYEIPALLLKYQIEINLISEWIGQNKVRNASIELSCVMLLFSLSILYFK